MTRRITLTIIATVLISVLLAGIGTFVLVRHEDRRSTQASLAATADAMAFVFSEFPVLSARDQDNLRARLATARQHLRVADAELLIIRRNGEIIGTLPEGLDQGRIDVAALRAEGRLSGTQGSIVYAAALASRPGFDYGIILTADGGRLTDPMARWIILSTVLALAAGSLMAWMIGRRLAAPVQAASRAAHRVAAGDLAIRVPVDTDRTDEIAELGTAINDMAASLERAKGLERQFLLSVSHDLRTPLTSIRGYAEAIGDGTAGDSRRAAEIISAEARRLERLVTDLLDLAKLDAHQFSLQLRATDLGEVVPDVCAGFEHRAAADGLQILGSGPEQPVLARADPDRLAQVLANLLENALKYATRRITVTYGHGVDGLEVVVADDGHGIATEHLPHVFDRLYVTGERPQRRDVGSGLGLAIVKELVEAMGGTVVALARPSGGTRFVVTLRPA